MAKAETTAEPVQETLSDNTVVIDQDTVTSTVVVDGNTTIRTYTDGAIQRNFHATPELAQQYANEVAALEGGK